MAAIKNDPPKATSALAQLDLIEATATRADAMRRATASESESQIYQILSELRRDIEMLKHEERTASMTSDERMMHELLVELRRDINALKGEQELVTTRPKDRQLQMLLAELREDITALNRLSVVPGLHATLDGAARRSAPSVAYSLKLGIPLGILGGITSAFALLLATGLIRIDTNSALRAPEAPTDRSLLPPAAVPSPPPQAAVAPPAPVMATAEQLIQTANVLLGRGEIAFARQVLTNATTQGNVTAALLLARVYDPMQLAQMYNPSGVAPDLERARTFYEIAAQSGNAEAIARINELRNEK